MPRAGPLWRATAGGVLSVALVWKALRFAIIQRHGAVPIKFLVVWLLGWLLISVILVGALGPVGNGPTWNSVGVAGGILIAAAVCFLTARRMA